MKWNFLYQITAASRTPDWGLPPPDPRSLCPLSSTEFVEPPPEQNSWACHWRLQYSLKHKSDMPGPWNYSLYTVPKILLFALLYPVAAGYTLITARKAVV